MKACLVLPTALLLSGCSLHHRTLAPEPARSPARDSLFRLDESRADSVAIHGAVDGALTLLAGDVIYLRAGVPAVYGLAAVRTLLPATNPPGAPVSAWQPLGGGVSNDLGSAYTFGVAARAVAGAGSGPIQLARYIAFWRRSGGAPWRIVAYAEVAQPASGEEPTFPPEQLSPPSDSAPPRIAAARAQIRSADSSFSDLAIRMGLAFAFSTTAAPDGAVFGDPALIVGPNAIRTYLSEQPGGSSLTWHPVYADVAASRDLGFTIGEYVSTGLGPSGATVQRFGKYLTVWQRQRNGDWRFVIDGGSPDGGRIGGESRAPKY
jgi:ketosteroid isomerase-like protein